MLVLVQVYLIYKNIVGLCFRAPTSIFHISALQSMSIDMHGSSVSGSKCSVIMTRHDTVDVCIIHQENMSVQ